MGNNVVNQHLRLDIKLFKIYTSECTHVCIYIYIHKVSVHIT